MTEQTKTRIPAPLYAAAGAGDYAFEQLRKLPAVVSELSDKAGARAGSLRTADFDQLRDNATGGALAFAQLASERAISLYTTLVARGERVVGSGVVEAADVVNADMEATEEPKAVEATPSPEAPSPEALATPKPRKRATKPAAN